MNHYMPNGGLEENNNPPSPHPVDIDNLLFALSNNICSTTDLHRINHELTELRLSEDGLVGPQGLQSPYFTNADSLTATLPAPGPWQSGGTLESIVDEATRISSRKPNVLPVCISCTGDEFRPPFENLQNNCPLPEPSLPFSVDSAVPCSSMLGHDGIQGYYYVPNTGNCVMGCCSTSYPESSCSVASVVDPRLPIFSVATKGDLSVTGGSTPFGGDSHHLTLDTCYRQLITLDSDSPFLGSPENSISAKQCTKTVDDQDSVCNGRTERERAQEGKKKGNGKFSVPARKTRSAIHNQSERKRRDKINQKIKTLQMMVPNSIKTDKASMLDEVIEYLRITKAQVAILRSTMMNYRPAMLPLAMQQQLQMYMPRNVGMNNFVDVNSFRPHNVAGMPPALPLSPFMQGTSWDGLGVGDLLPTAAANPSSCEAPDPLAALFAFHQSQPMTPDAHAVLAAFCQQFQLPPTSGP